MSYWDSISWKVPTNVDEPTSAGSRFRSLETPESDIEPKSYQIEVTICFAKPILLNVSRDSTAEDVIIEVCKRLKISPVTRPLFALKNSSLSPNAWLTLEHEIKSDIRKQYECAIRFKVPDASKLRHIDLKTFDFYFRQVRHHILTNKVPNIDVDKQVSEIIGLGVTDMVRATLEDGLSDEVVIRKYGDFVPNYAKKRHRIFLKKPMKKSFLETRTNNLCADSLKCYYLDAFQVLAKDYLVEEYKALIIKDNDDQNLCSAVIRVDPFASEHPGVNIKEENEKWKHFCSIADLCFIDIKDNYVTIGRSNGVQITLKFHIITDMKSFVSLLDGYYRLTIKWTFNLCSALKTPSLVRLYNRRCHGPVSREFSYRKLAEKGHNECGSFILRESDSDYDAYYIDVCIKSSKIPKTLKILKIGDRYRLEEALEILKSQLYHQIEKAEANYAGNYKKFLMDEKQPKEAQFYQSIQDLLRELRTEEIKLVRCLPPSEYDKSNLLLCQVESGSTRSRSQYADLEAVLADRPAVIDPKRLMSYRSTNKSRENRATDVYHGVWYKNQNTEQKVAIRTLLKTDHKSLAEFISMGARWGNVKTTVAVKLYGMSLYDPTAMVMEHMPLGSLDEYLKDPDKRSSITEIILVETAKNLASALHFLAEKKFVHGNIRCRKLLVAAQTEHSFVVKLSDPGYGNPYTDFDLHWIPPEYHRTPDRARDTTSSDVWAYATTLWEIFSYGAVPPERDVEKIKDFYKTCGNHLPMPNACPKMMYEIMEECWRYDAYWRKKPQEIARDVNHLFYQVYNARLWNKNHYTEIGSSTKREPDSVSTNSKTSAECSSSALSNTTMNTLVDDSDETILVNLHESVKRMNLTNGELPPLNFFNSLNSDLRMLDSFCTPNGEMQTKDVFNTPTVYADIRADEMVALSGWSEKSSKDDAENFFSITSLQSVFELDKDWHLVLKGVIGEGNYGQVFTGELLHHYDELEPKKVAVKKLKPYIWNRAERVREMDDEIETMKRLEHENVVKMYGYVRDPELCLVLEFIEHGSLKCYVSMYEDRLDAHHLMKFALDIAKGMEYLNSKKIVHRDLAARNVLVGRYAAKISDFGLARFVGENNYYLFTQQFKYLPMQWYAPECLEHRKFSFQSDVWSYGVTLYEMFTYGAEPSLPNFEKATAYDTLTALKNNIRLPMPPKCPQYVYTRIMTPCWQYEAAQRPTFTDLCKMISEAPHDG